MIFLTYKLDIGKMNITKSHVGELVNETISDLNSFIVEKYLVFTDIKIIKV
jgi:hypothetical protein